MKKLFVLLVSVLFATSAIADDNAAMDHGDVDLFHYVRTELDYTPQFDGLFTWDMTGWVGGDSERVWLRSEGEVEDGRATRAESQLYYGWNIHPFWDALIGVRQDFEPRSTTYLAGSIVGLAPYDFETEASIYLSDRGDLSARLEQSFDILLTQRLIAEPHGQVDVFAQDVPEQGIGAGISHIELGLQLRYEFERKFAPYIDAVWERKLGETAAMARRAGEDPDESSIRVGVRFWF